LPAKHASASIAVASRFIPAGSIVRQGDVGMKQVSGPLKSGTIQSATDAVGRIAVSGLAPGHAFTQDDLRDASSVGIAARVDIGRRAFSIRVGEDDIVGGFLQSGDRVDVLATIPGSVFSNANPSGSDRSRSTLLLQNILVLAVGENPATRGAVQSSAHTVSLSLAPEQIARLALAQRYGKVSLAIRRPGDTGISPSVSAMLDDLLPVTASQAPHPRHRNAPGIPFYAGTRASTLAQDAIR
jgi:pilus assembly protein CpaB